MAAYNLQASAALAVAAPTSRISSPADETTTTGDELPDCSRNPRWATSDPRSSSSSSVLQPPRKHPRRPKPQSDHHHQQQQQQQPNRTAPPRPAPDAAATVSGHPERPEAPDASADASSSSSWTDSTTVTSKAAGSIYKFLAWFSGRRRPTCLHQRYRALVPYFTIFLVFSLLRNTDACSSRTIPKPRPPTPTPRPSITFHTFKCPPAYAAWYCLNDARCFTVKIGDSLLYNCECAAGYMGPRCEYKDLDGSYLPSRPSAMLSTAGYYAGSILAVLLIAILCAFYWHHWHQQRKAKRLELEQLQDANANNAAGVDTVDGVGGGGLHTVRCMRPEMRPFGPHHLRTITMAEALMKR